MHYFHPVSRLAQVFGHVFRNHDGAVLAAGAAESDRQIAFPFPNVVRQKVDQQIRDALNELLGLGKRANVFRDFLVTPGELTELRHKVGIGQEANIEYEVGIVWDAMAETKAYAGNQNVLAGLLLLLEALDDMRTK